MHLMRFLSLPLLVVLAGLSAAAERGPAVPDYPAEVVTDGVYVIHGPLGYPSPENQGFMNNPAFLITADGVIVVDPGSSVQTGEMVLRQIRRHSDKPVLAVLNTHVHGDHWLGNQAVRAAYPEVPIYAHPKMLAAVEAGAGAEWVDLMLRSTDSATAGTGVVGPNLAVADGDELSIGGLTLRFHAYDKVHTKADLMIEVPERSLLFLGDNACNERIVRMDDGSFSGSIEALDDIRRRVQADVLVPGHGRTGGWEIVERYRGYLSGLYETVSALYDEGLSDYEMKDQVADRLADYQNWKGYDEELGRHISLAYLEAEAAAF